MSENIVAQKEIYDIRMGQDIALVYRTWDLFSFHQECLIHDVHILYSWSGTRTFGKKWENIYYWSDAIIISTFLSHILKI